MKQNTTEMRPCLKLGSNLLISAFDRALITTSMAEQIKTNGSTPCLFSYPSSSPSIYHMENMILRSMIGGGGFDKLQVTIPKSIEKPQPTRMFMTGPATVAVIAISPNPFLVMATSAERSPSELAHARIDKDRSGWGSPVTNPRS